MNPNPHFHLRMFGVMFCMAGIVILLMAINKNQAWYMRYIEVAFGLLCIVLGIMIPLSLRNLGYGW